ncbi:MAG: HPP family protein [Porticoccaceae bacterium]
MPKDIKLADVMTPSPKTIAIDAHLSEAKKLLEEMNVNQLPVMNAGVVESIITDKDIKRFTLPAHKIGADEDLLVSDIATTRAFVADAQDSLEKVLRQMIKQQTSAVIVLDQGELAGIFTETDACRVLADLLAS